MSHKPFAQKFLFILAALTIIVFGFAIGKRFRQTARETDVRRKVVNLIVYAHSSFVDPYGPGPELKNLFEKNCECTVEYVDVGGANMSLQRLQLDPKRRVDVVLGLDLLLLAKAVEVASWQGLELPTVKLQADVKSFVFQKFIPYDWSPMGFIYRQGELTPAHSWAEAVKVFPAKSVSLQDPSLSTVGLEFLYWIFVTQKEEHMRDTLLKLQPAVHSYSPSWSSAYGLFKKGQTKAVFSYLTSLLYHWHEEKDRRYQFMEFTEGHPQQIEYAGVPETCWNCSEAKSFVKFLLSETAQQILYKKNFMLPTTLTAEVDAAMSELPKVKVFDNSQLSQFYQRQKAIVEMWEQAR